MGKHQLEGTRTLEASQAAAPRIIKASQPSRCHAFIPCAINTGGSALWSDSSVWGMEIAPLCTLYMAQTTWGGCRDTFSSSSPPSYATGFKIQHHRSPRQLRWS